MRAPLRWRARLRRAARHLRRWLGLPGLSRRTLVLVLLVFLGLAFVSVTLVADFVLKISGYAPWYYEPKDFEREEQAAKPPGKQPATKP